MASTCAPRPAAGFRSGLGLADQNPNPNPDHDPDTNPDPNPKRAHRVEHALERSEPEIGPVLQECPGEHVVRDEVSPSSSSSSASSGAAAWEKGGA